jgi:hypothetical protein
MMELKNKQFKDINEKSKKYNLILWLIFIKLVKPVIQIINSIKSIFYFILFYDKNTKKINSSLTQYRKIKFNKNPTLNNEIEKKLKI